jgi:hypothetical protein
MTVNKMIVFSVTVIDIIGDPVLGSRRTPGIFTSLEKALSVVKNNENDIADNNLYQYAIIEETLLDEIRPTLRDGVKLWFKYNTITDEFDPCSSLSLPLQLKRLHGFGIG